MSYARGTFAALVDALVPETPALADRGEEQVAGALDVDIDEMLTDAFNDLQEADEGLLTLLGYDSVPLAPIISVLLDVAALELIVRRETEAGLQSPDGRFAGGPFSRLGERDRLRAIRKLEEDGLLADIGAVNYLAQSVLTVAQVAYYSDWGGSEQGWEQAGYPGPADGYAVLMGYEVEEFEEDDY